jgi:hypothetical protein
MQFVEYLKLDPQLLFLAIHNTANEESWNGRRRFSWPDFSTLPLAYNVLMGDIPNSIAEDLHKK